MPHDEMKPTIQYHKAEKWEKWKHFGSHYGIDLAIQNTERYITHKEFTGDFTVWESALMPEGKQKSVTMFTGLDFKTKVENCRQLEDRGYMIRTVCFGNADPVLNYIEYVCDKPTGPDTRPAFEVGGWRVVRGGSA